MPLVVSVMCVLLMELVEDARRHSDQVCVFIKAFWFQGLYHRKFQDNCTKFRKINRKLERT